MAVTALMLAAPAADATVKAISAPPLSATAAVRFSGVVASFQSNDTPGKLFARIDWGDGSPVDTTPTVSANGAGGYDVTGAHTYAHETSVPVQVTVDDTGDKSSGTATTTATVADAPLKAAGTSATATRGVQFSGTVATFTDLDGSATAATFTATVDWGDGTTSAGAVAAGDGGGFRVTGTHVYVADGPRAVAVAIQDGGGASATASTTIEVSAPPSGGGGPPPPPPSPGPKAPPPFGVSTTSPATGQHVAFDAFALGVQHGGATAYHWDLNGDGIFERDTHRVPALAATFGLPGAYGVGLQIVFRDGTAMRAEQTIQVSGPPLAGCGAYCHVDFPFHGPAGGAGCEHTLRFGVVDAVGGCLRRTGAVYVADGEVRVNGIDLVPVDPTGHITLDPAGFTVSSGGASVIVQLGEVVLGRQAIAWTGLDGSGGGIPRATVPPLPGVGSFEGFPFVGSAATTLTHVINRDPAHPVDHGVATVGAYVQLPDFIGGISVAVGLSTDNDAGLSLDQLHVHLSDARLKFLPIKQLDVDYDASGERWGGGLQVDLGSYEVGAAVGLRPVDQSRPDGDLTLDHVSADLDSLNVSIYAGVFLQSIRAGFTLGPPADIFTGGVTFSEGPKVSDIDLIQLMGDFTVTSPVPAGGPLDFNLAAELDVLSFKVGTATADVRTDGNFSFGAHVRIPYFDDGQPVPNPRIQADVSGFIDGPHGTWDAEGSAHLCLGPCLGVSALVSNIAAAGCLDLGFGDVGAAYTWADRRLAGFGGFGGSCDLGAWRPAHPSARAAGVAGQTLSLPAGMRLAAFQVTGSGSPPRVTFEGPHGLIVATPAGALGARTAHTWLYEDPKTDTTNLAVSGRLGGTWTIVPQPGSSPVTSVTDSYGLPPVSITAKLGGKGRARSLRYAITPQPGLKVRFAETARKAASVIGQARGANGVLRFAPTDGPAGRRRIVALVSQGGRPRKQIVVASYVAPGPFRPAAPRVGVARAKSRLRVSWSRAPGAGAYEVVVKTFNRRRQLFELPARRRVLVVADILPTYRTRISVRSISRHHQPGAAAAVTVRPAGTKSRAPSASRTA